MQEQITKNVTDSTLKDRIYGCWVGKSIGGTLGLPAEGKMERLNFSFYDPVPTIAPPNDDLELQLVWLDVVENAGTELTQEDFAKAWLNHIHYMWDEYGRCRWNLRRGVPASQSGTFENYFQSAMGSPIRSEIWACLFPGDPDSAAHYAAMDASLDHGIEGISGEAFFAVMQVHAMDVDIHEAIALALNYISPESETSRAINLVISSHGNNVPAWDCWQLIKKNHAPENFTHAPLNVALTIWALLYGEGDFEKSILLAVNGGYDTDCTAATVGATLGLKMGAIAIPARWKAPIGDGVSIGNGIFDIDAPQTLQELADRTLALIGKLSPQLWNLSTWTKTEAPVDLEKLPGTIWLQPLDGSPKVPWANGPLPEEVKSAGGATWTWTTTRDELRRVSCLARPGASLFVDGSLAVKCPANLLYIPATHRCPHESRAVLEPKPGTHEIRLELESKDPQQDSSVILFYLNYHIAPWTEKELPELARLPIPPP